MAQVSDAAATVADASTVLPVDAAAQPSDAAGPVDSGTVIAGDTGTGTDQPADTSVYGCQCTTAAGLMPLGLLVFVFRPWRRRRG